MSDWQIPPFNEDGHIPYGFHPSTLKEYKERFVTEFTNSETRNYIFTEFIGYSGFLLSFNLATEKWMSGSFTSAKLNPSDIDMVVLYDGIKYNGHPNENEFDFFFLSRSGYKDLLHHTIYLAVYPEKDPRYQLYKREYKKWRDFFSITRDDKPRGLVVIDTLSEEYITTLNKELIG
jgi:hypothetical protein